MNPGIFLIQENGDLVEMNEQPYDSEDLLQTLLAKYPSLLAGNQINPGTPRKWLLIERECGVPSEEGGGGRFSIDHLFLDQDAIPTIVEVKRSTDTRIRREVVGQMLDYAANAVVYFPVERMRERFARTHGSVADDTIDEFLDGRMEAEDFWQLANDNLQKKKVRLLFVADQIPTGPKRIVEFLNEQMVGTEVLAVEIKQFVGGERRGLVPRVIGQTAEAKTIESQRPPPVTVNEILDALSARSPGEAAVAQQILDRFNTEVAFAKDTFVPKFECGSETFTPIAVDRHGRIVIRFGVIGKKRPFDDRNKRLEFFRLLNLIPGVSLPEDKIDKYPKIEPTALENGDAFGKFVNAVTWAIGEVKNAQQTADL